MYKIGEFSKMNRITIKALRYYDEIGLFKPCLVDAFTGYRYYSGDQIQILNEIVALKEIGFSLEEIIEITSKGVDPDRMLELLRRKEEETALHIADEEAKLTRIIKHIDKLKENRFMKQNIEIKELPEVIVASMRKVIADYGEYNSIYPEMGHYMEEQKVTCREPEYCFTIYHDGEYKERDIDVEICQAVTDYAKDSDKVKFKKIDRISTAACIIKNGGI